MLWAKQRPKFKAPASLMYLVYTSWGPPKTKNLIVRYSDSAMQSG